MSKCSEELYKKALIQNFNMAFPIYDFVKSERVTIDYDRIDILAKCKETNRDVIIELKVGNKSGHKQLRSYAYEFDNPILINISEQLPKRECADVAYKTFGELGILAPAIKIKKKDNINLYFISLRYEFATESRYKEVYEMLNLISTENKILNENADQLIEAGFIRSMISGGFLVDGKRSDFIDLSKSYSIKTNTKYTESGKTESVEFNEDK